MSVTNIYIPTRRPTRLFASLSVATLSLSLLLASPVSARMTRGSAETSTSGAPVSGSARAGARLRGQCQISIETTAGQIAAGEAPTLFGTLVCAEPASAAGQLVSLYQRQRGSGAGGATVDGTTITKSDGSYRLSAAALDADSFLYVRCAGARSAHIMLRLSAQITLSGAPDGAQLLIARRDSVTPAQNTVRFSGTVNPAGAAAGAGGVVILQRMDARRAGHWHRIGVTPLGAGGVYSITRSFRVSGEVIVRAVVRTGHHSLLGISQPLTYHVSHEQNARLTILASADPIPDGQSVTISGVAARANHPVTLLARTPGSGFTPVARSMTDGAGNYSFIQSPVQSTAYRVTAGAGRSTVLLVGVAPALTAATAAT